MSEISDSGSTTLTQRAFFSSTISSSSSSTSSAIASKVGLLETRFDFGGLLGTSSPFFTPPLLGLPFLGLLCGLDDGLLSGESPALIMILDNGEGTMGA